MTIPERLAFLEAKYRLIEPLIDAAEAEILRLHFAKFAEGQQAAIPAKQWGSVLQQVDAKMERLIVEWVQEEDEATLRQTLQQQFGFSAFGAEPKKVLQRILKEQRIRNEEEAKLVSDFLSGSYLGWDASEEQRVKFNQILGAYEGRR